MNRLKSWITNLLFLAAFLVLLLAQDAITTWLYSGNDCWSRLFTACYEKDYPPGARPPEEHLQ